MTLDTKQHQSYDTIQNNTSHMTLDTTQQHSYDTLYKTTPVI